VKLSGPVGFPKAWTITGYSLFFAAAILVARILYEETILTWVSGPQMVGFAMAHGALAPIFIVGSIALPGILLWLAVSLVLLMWKKLRLLDWIPAILSILLMALLSVPYETWEEFVVRIAGPGSHGSDFLVQAAAHDKRRFVALLLRKGYDVNYEDRGGTTPLSATSVGGHEKMIRFLISKGAQVNRKSGSVGETPLIAAAEMGHLGSVTVLLENGADACLTDKEGHTAEGRAKEYHHNDIAEYLSSRFHCPENVINPPCVDSAFSACVHP
jgi:Ankyrin repeats (3 copies)